MEGFGSFFNDPEFQRRMAEMAEQMQSTQTLAWADNAIKLAVGWFVAFALLSARVRAFWARVRQGLTILFDRRRYIREVFAGTAGGATVAAYSVGQQIAIATSTFAAGFAALVFVFKIRSVMATVFPEAVTLVREARQGLT